MTKTHVWISVATFIGALAGSLLFSPSLAMVRCSAPISMATMPSHTKAETIMGARSVESFNWGACSANQNCLKAMGAFYSTVAKPAYPIIETK